MENIIHRAGLHHLAMVHHDDLVGNLRHHAHVVRDKHHSHALGPLQILDQIQNLGLGGHIQCRRRFIRNQQRRLAGQRHGDHHPLTHPARKLEGVAVHRFGGIGNLNLGQQLHAACPGLLLGHFEVQRQHLHDLVAHRVHRRQGGHGLLENHGDLSTAHRADLPRTRAQPGQVHAAAIRAVQ